MAAYVIYQAEVSDPERYEEYKTKAAACIVAAGGKYIVRGGEVDVLEGEAPAGRTVVLEFATMKTAEIGIEARSTARSAKSAKGQHAVGCTSSMESPNRATRITGRSFGTSDAQRRLSASPRSWPHTRRYTGDLVKHCFRIFVRGGRRRGPRGRVGCGLGRGCVGGG